MVPFIFCGLEEWISILLFVLSIYCSLAIFGFNLRNICVLHVQLGVGVADERWL